MTRRVVFVLAVAALVSTTSGAALASGRRAGDALVVTNAGSSKIRKSGGSATPFSLKLPENSTCPGDSADDNYRVQSFFVPASVDPGSTRYKSQGPDVAGGWAVYRTTTNAYIQEQTADAKNPGDPGPIIALPALSFAVFTGNELSAGRFRIGVACTLFNRTVKYWDTEIVLTTDPADAPAHLRWRLAHVPVAGTSDKPKVGLIVIVMTLLAGGALFAARLRSAP